MSAPSRVLATPEALRWIDILREKHGDLLFHQPHGCCEGGAAPVCIPETEYRPIPDDRVLGLIGGCPFYISGVQFEQWRNFTATVDVASGLGAGFSLEATEGVGFFIRLHLCNAAEIERLAPASAPSGAD